MKKMIIKVKFNKLNMGNILQNHDVLGVIYNLTNNYNCTLLSKEFYEIICKNSIKCNHCHKLTKIFDIVQWITDDTDEICHGYYKNIEYYTMIKRMLSLSPSFFEKIERQCYALCYYALKCDPMNIKYIHNQTKLFCNYALNKNLLSIGFIKNPSEKMCFRVIRKNIKYFQYINLNTPFANKICIEAVNIDGLQLQHVPEEYITSQLCYDAVYNNVKAFEYVPKIYQTDELRTYVLHKMPNMIYHIEKPTEEHYVELFKLDTDIFYKIFPHKTTIFTQQKNNTAMGHGALNKCIDGNNNTCIGYNSGIEIRKDNNIIIGNNGTKYDDGVIRLGSDQLKNFQAGIYGTILEEAVPVYISSSGQLGTKK